uniref:NADP-dependent 3-hydroxy acid dehydrogenase YdfG n=1 Tax=Pinctada fucata TaxID=50426 RepID=A0A194AMQ0_PINFU
MIDLNVKGFTNCIGAILEGMVQRKSGHIVNLSSDAGRKGFPGLAVYSGTKFYVEGLSQALRQEVCGLGIRVTNLQPGDVRTELFIHTTDKEAQDAYDGSQKCKILEPEDIANAVLYAVTQPEYVGVHEILIEPREAPL